MTLTQLIRTTTMAAALALPAPVWAAQQPGHQMTVSQMQPASPMAVAECAQAQPQAMRTIDAANMRLEAARQNNSPPAMRAAVDDLQDALRQLRAQLAACAGLQAAAPADSGAGHVMPRMPQAPPPSPGTPVMQPGSTTPAPAAPAPAAADPHAGHATPKAPAAPVGKPATKPASAKPAPAAPAHDPHAGQGMTPPPAREAKEAQPASAMDPVTGLMVDPRTAPKATYQNQTYYFSSEQAREEFLQNPVKFVKKPKR